MAKLNTITEDENHQGTRRIFGVPTPYRGDEAVNKWYVDQQIQIVIETGGGGFADNMLLMGA